MFQMLPDHRGRNLRHEMRIESGGAGNNGDVGGITFVAGAADAYGVEGKKTA
jgi:hypothetical protein